jgi:hypothetical protein
VSRVSKQLREAHPDQPWLWRQDWADGRVGSADGATAAVAWLFAICFGGFSIPLFLRADATLQESGLGIMALAMLFPLAALGMLWWAISATLRWRRFRGICFELGTRPGVIGGRLRGTVHLGRQLAPDEGYTLRLSCIRKSRSGKNTSETLEWQEEKVVPRVQAGFGPMGTTVPVDFRVPFEAKPSSPDPVRLPAIQWRLEVGAKLPGADLASVFEVPVFETSESSAEITDTLSLEEGEESAPLDDEASLRALERDPRVRISTLPEGGMELFFPAGRNRAGALALTVFCGMWNTFIVYAAGAMPGAFALALLPFALVGLLLLVLVPVAWLQTTRVRARAGQLEIARRVLGMGRTLQLRTDEIDSIAAETQGAHGRGALYRVRIHRKGRKPTSAGSDLRSKRDAQRVAVALLRALRA